MLVTGSHRSGTGWVARVLAGSIDPRLHYVWEPFSVRARPGVCAAGFQVWFPYVCDENEHAYFDAIADTVALRYRTGAELRTIRSMKDVARMLREGDDMRRARRQGAAALLKDPIALFSAGWLQRRFGAAPVVLIRHPAAFASSIVRLGWRHDFGDFLAQPLLMRDRLQPFEPEIRRFAAAEQPLLDQAVLLWNILHAEIARLRDEHPTWLFRRQEDLARAPMEEFAALYEALDLDATRLAETVEHYSGAANPALASRPDAVRRDSAGGVSLWKQRLGPDAIARVREGTAEVARHFYGPDDW